MRAWLGAALTLGAFALACGSAPKDLDPPPDEPTSVGPPSTWVVTAGNDHEARSGRFVLKGEIGAFVHAAVRPSTADGRVLGGEN